MKVIRIENNKFKTNEMAVLLSVPLKRETITKNALLPAVLKRGSMNYKNQLEIGKALENMYGASFSAGVDKTGDYLILKFYIESLCNEYIEEDRNLANESIELLFDIIFNPLVVNGSFDENYVEQEKKKLENIINSRQDNKDTYSLNRCIEEMFKGEPYGLYKYGYVEDLKDINAQSLYEYYLEMLKECKMSVAINGKEAKNITIPKVKYDIEELNIEDDTENNISAKCVNCQDKEKKSDNLNNIEKAKDKDTELNHIANLEEGKQTENLEGQNVKAECREKVVKEELDVTQGKLIIGMDVKCENKFAVTMYNVVLGGGANSKLFQNVREKASLAYFSSSSYIRRKNAIIIRTGIELKNYEKALSIIKEQLQEMKNGNITEKEIESGRKLVTSSLKMITESQEDQITYAFDQELFDENLELEEYIKKIEAVTKDDIVKAANSININTIYYLKDKE